MKDFFWQSILGLVLLFVVAVIALNPANLALGTGSFLEKAVSLSGAGRFFKEEEKAVKSGGNLPVVVLDAGHGGCHLCNLGRKLSKSF